MQHALLLIDFINDIVHPQGKLAGKGYAIHMAERQVVQHLQKALETARAKQMPVIHVRVGFSPDYQEQPKHSPLFGKADVFQALTLGNWGTTYYEELAPQKGEHDLIKHRVSAFYGTSLDMLLRTLGVTHVYIAGVATDLAVSSAARDAHDRDYHVTVLADCCAAANEEDHRMTLRSLEKIATIQHGEEL